MRLRPAPAAAADLSLTKTDSPDPVSTGAPLTYSIRVSNAGPDAATNVVVTDNLPKGVGFVSAESTQGSCAAVADKKKAQKITCTLGALASSAGPQLQRHSHRDHDSCSRSAEGGHDLQYRLGGRRSERPQ